MAAMNSPTQRTAKCQGRMPTPAARSATRPRPGRADDSDDVLLHGVGEMHVTNAGLRGEELVRGHDLAEGVERVMDALRVQDVDLFLRLGVAQLQPDEESVQLRLGEREGPFVL